MMKRIRMHWNVGIMIFQNEEKTHTEFSKEVN